jgi:hypothetical protein
MSLKGPFMTLVEVKGWQLLPVRVMSCCLCWARSRHTNPPASCTAGSQAGPRRSTPRPSGARQGAGSCGSPWKSSAPKIGVDLGITTLAVFSDGRPPAENPKHYDTPPAQTRSAVPRGVPQNRGRTGAPVSARPTVGAAPTTDATRSTTGYQTCAVMASRSSLPALPASTARSWWKTSPWPRC